MKKLLIFGAAGFVGPYLAKEFIKSGYEIYATDIVDEENDLYKKFFKVDILNKEAVCNLIKNVNPTHIVNLAAISSVGVSWKIPDKTMSININGTINILEACIYSKIKPRVLLIGSSEEYSNSLTPIDEKNPIDATNPYGISKVAQEQFAKIYRKKYDWKIFCVRSFNHIGIGQKTTFVIPSWCNQVAKIEKGIDRPVINVGNLNVSRDFSSVKDIVSAYKMIIESDKEDEIYNIGQGKAYLLKDILNYIISLSTKEININIDSSLIRSNDNSIICCNNKKIRDEIGWVPKIDIYDEIKQIYEDMLYEKNTD